MEAKSWTRNDVTQTIKTWLKTKSLKNKKPEAEPVMTSHEFLRPDQKWRHPNYKKLTKNQITKILEAGSWTRIDVTQTIKTWLKTKSLKNKKPEAEPVMTSHEF